MITYKRILPLSFLFVFLFCSTSFAASIQRADIESLVGEKLTFSIHKLMMKVGEVTLEFKGFTQYEDAEVILVEFNAKGPKFSDYDKIYLNPITFLPIVVERDVNVFGSKERISELYDPRGSVRVVKEVKGKTEEEVIEKDGPLENIYGFIYRYRLQNKFEVGDEMFIRLPTLDVTMKTKKLQTYKFAKERHETLFMQSDPKKFQIWFGTSGAKIPYRIDGAVGFGSTSMRLKSYQAP